MATVKFPSEMSPATSIGGNDKLMISKESTGEAYQATFNQAKDYLAITGIELEPLVGGTTSGTALVVPNGPAGEQRTAEVASGLWYDFGSGAVQTDASKRWKSYWNGSSWSLKDMGALPVSPSTDSIEKDNILPVESDAVYKELNVGSVKESPLGRIAQTFTTTSSVGYTYYDIRCIVTDKSLLKDVNIKFRIVGNVGSIDLVAISLKGVILHSETKTGFTATNPIVKFDDLSSVNEPFYVGIRQNAGDGSIALKPTTDVGYAFWRPNGTGSFGQLVYDLAYSINLYDGGVQGTLSSFQIMLKSDTTKIRQNLSKSNKVSLDATPVTIEDKIEIPNGAVLEGVFGKSVIKLGSGLTTEALSVEGKEDIVIRGLKIVGSQPNYAYSMNGINSGAGIIADSTEALANTYQGTEVGMLAKSSENLILEGIQFHNINGVGLIGDYVGRNYIKGMKASKLLFANCYKGLETRNEHEYSNYTDLMVSLCQIGVDINSGNLLFTGLINTRCRYGTIIRGSGLNHAHGLFSGSEIKHHQLAGLLIDNVEYGQMFDGLMMQYANIVIQNSRLVTIPDLYFSNGSISCTNTDKTGKNVIGNLYRAGTVTLNNTGNLLVNNDINLTI